MNFWKKKEPETNGAISERKESSRNKLEAATQWTEQLEKLKEQLKACNIERRFHVIPVELERRRA